MIYPLWFERTEGERECRPAWLMVVKSEIVVTSILSAWNCFHPSGRRGEGWCISCSMTAYNHTERRKWYAKYTFFWQRGFWWWRWVLPAKISGAHLQRREGTKYVRVPFSEDEKTPVGPPHRIGLLWLVDSLQKLIFNRKNCYCIITWSRNSIRNIPFWN